jgi:hypothetical protein
MTCTGRVGALLCVVLVATACGDEEPAGAREETELINEVTLTLMRRQDSTFQHAVVVDPDGRGPLPWQAQEGTLHLLPNASYTATITLTNSTVTPPVDVTPLINSLKLQHRFFYAVDPEGGVIATDLTIDSNSAEYGEAFAIHVPAGVESRTWTLGVLLSHYEGDSKGNGLLPGTLTDVEVSFQLDT